MLRRLTMMVFVLSLIIAFGASAFAGPGLDGSKRQAMRDLTVNQSTGTKVLAQPGTVEPTGWNRPSLVERSGVLPGSKQVTMSPDTNACYLQDYVDWANFCGSVYVWDFFGTDPGYIATRYDIPAGHTAEVNSVTVRVAESSANVGTGCNMVVSFFYDDGAGLPTGAPFHTVVADLSAFNPIPWAGGWMSVPTPGLVIENETSYHVALNSTGDASDYLTYLSTNEPACPGIVSSGRGTYSADGVTWLTNPAAFGGQDLDYWMDVDQCVYYSSCSNYYGLAGGTGYVGLWIHPDPAWGSGEIMNGFGQRFVSAGPDTITTVDVQHLIPAWFFGDLAGYDGTSTNGFEVSFWPDDGTGNVDYSGGALATEVVPGGLANIFPATGNVVSGSPWEHVFVDFTAHNLVLLGPWHVTVKMTSDNDADGIVLLGLNSTTSNPGLTGASVNFTPPDPNWERTGTNATWLAEGGGEEQGMLVRVYYCRDEFYNCQTQMLYDGPAEWAWGIGELGWAQKVAGKPVNRVEEIRFEAFDWLGLDAASYDVFIHAATPGGPGAVLGGPYNTGPVIDGWTTVVIPGGGLQVLGDFFVAVMYDYGPGGDPTILSEDGSFHGGPHNQINGGAWLHDGSGWFTVTDYFGYVDNLMVDVDFCSIIVDERICVPGDDWTTVGHDFARTGASGNPVEDAWCDLNLTGMWEHPIAGTQRNGPIIWEGLVVQAWATGTDSDYLIFDLTNIGAGPVDGIGSGGGGSIAPQVDAQTFGGSVRCTPTIADVGGVPMLFVAGGTANAVAAYDMSSLPITLVWKCTPFNAWLGHTGFMASVRYGEMVVADDGLGTMVAYWMDDNAVVYAADAATGLPYLGWAGPYSLGAPSYKSMTYDGTNLLFATSVPGGFGNIIAISATTGAYVWDLASGDGLQATAVYPALTISAESFDGGIAVSDGEAYVMSYVSGSNTPASGVFYRLNAANGALLSASQGIRAFQSHPIVDASAVYNLGMYNWGGDIALGGTVTAYNRANGNLIWASGPTAPGGALETWHRHEGLLTCEPDAPDILFAFNGSWSGDHGYLYAANANTGEELFQRRIDHGAGANTGGGGAVALDVTGATHIVFVDSWGVMYDLSKGADRPRLQLLAANATLPVPFGTGPDEVFTFPDMYKNTGCADLTVTFTATDVSNGVTPPAPGFRSVRTEFADDMSNLADQMTNKFATRFAPEVPFVDTDADFTRESSRVTTSRSASAIPGFLVDAGGGDVFEPTGQNALGFVTAAGANGSIGVHVNGTLINRGPQDFYVEYTTHNDPDYFLNDNSLVPEQRMILVGGCLTEFVTLEFGAAGANSAPVFNMGRMANGGAETLDIDADGGAFYQGTYIMGVDTYRIAMNTQDWHGGADDVAYKSMQADPNWCDDDCTPLLTTDIPLGFITNNGFDYREIRGNTVCKSYIDSVENFDLGGGWDWTNNGFTAFDDTLSFGVYMNSTTYGLLDDSISANGVLDNMFLEKMTFSERNGNPLPGWKFAALVDYDIRFAGPTDVGDTAGLDADISTAWAYDLGSIGGTGYVFGMTKIPFGCGEAPMKNVLALDAEQALFSDVYFDSAYYYMTLPAGDHSHTVLGTAGTQDDEEWHATIFEHDFVGSDEVTFGVVNFAFVDELNPEDPSGRISEVAILANQFAGFGRGDVNGDGSIGLADIIYLADYANGAGLKPGPIPFEHLGDVDGSFDGVIDVLDVTAMINYYFNATGLSCLPGRWEI